MSNDSTLSEPRRRFLQIVAASSATAGVGGALSVQQDEQDQNGQESGDQTGEIPVAGDFPQGPTVGLQKVAEGLPAPTAMDYLETDEGERHFFVTQTGQIYAHQPGEGMAGGQAQGGDGQDETLEADRAEGEAANATAANETGAGNESNETAIGNASEAVQDNESGMGNASDPGMGNESAGAGQSDAGQGAGTADADEFRFLGTASAWRGESPEAIANEENPTLQLQAGETYTFTWENADGEPHNVVLLSEDGDIIARTEIIEEAGATQSLEFEATREMSRYVCEVHATTMVGEIEIVDGGQQGGTGAATPNDMDLFLDIENQLVELGIGQLGDYDERGLLDMAFHPDFQQNRKFYVRYSAPSREGTPEEFDHTAVLSEFQAPEEWGQQVDPSTERVIMEVPEPQDNHNGGKLAFGPDGYLYVSLGDGGNVHDIGPGHVEDWYEDNEGGNGQDTEQNSLGGIHRIAVDPSSDQASQGPDQGAFQVPEDNPLVGQGDHIESYYAWGFRNPWGMSITDDGQMFVTDAGQHRIESAYLVEGGNNYSWNVKEGSECFSPANPLDPPEDCPQETPQDVRGGEPLRDPIVEFRHADETEAFIDNSVVVGGHRYAGDALSELQDGYVFGNWSNYGVVRAAGELLVAMQSNGGDTATTTGGDGTGNESEAVMDNESEAVMDNESEAVMDNESDAEMGNETGGTTEDPAEQDWSLQALQIQNAENNSLNRYVYGVERDADGELYALTNTDYRPFPESGEVYKIVPEGEGEEIPAPENPETVDPEEGGYSQDGEGQAAAETQIDGPGAAADNESAGDGAMGNQTDAASGMDNETGGAGNESTTGDASTAGNESDY